MFLLTAFTCGGVALSPLIDRARVGATVVTSAVGVAMLGGAALLRPDRDEVEDVLLVVRPAPDGDP